MYSVIGWLELPFPVMVEYDRQVEIATRDGNLRWVHLCLRNDLVEVYTWNWWDQEQELAAALDALTEGEAFAPAEGSSSPELVARGELEAMVVVPAT